MLPTGPRKILIVSSHPLFSQGLHCLLKKRSAENVSVVGLASGMEEALQMIENQKPHLVVVDYDDQQLDRTTFLARMICSSYQLRVVLISLLEGGSDAIIYDRKTIAASEIAGWLDEPTGVDSNTASIG